MRTTAKVIEGLMDRSTVAIDAVVTIEKLQRENAALQERVDRVERIYKLQLQHGVSLEREALFFSRNRTLRLDLLLTAESLEYAGIGAIEAIVSNVHAKLIDASYPVLVKTLVLSSPASADSILPHDGWAGLRNG